MSESVKTPRKAAKSVSQGIAHANAVDYRIASLKGRDLEQKEAQSRDRAHEAYLAVGYALRKVVDDREVPKETGVHEDKKKPVLREQLHPITAGRNGVS